MADRIKKFVCDKCKHRFEGRDEKWRGSTLSTPLRCPACKSYHTRPVSLFGLNKWLYLKIWDFLDHQDDK